LAHAADEAATEDQVEEAAEDEAAVGKGAPLLLPQVVAESASVAGSASDAAAREEEVGEEPVEWAPAADAAEIPVPVAADDAVVADVDEEGQDTDRQQEHPPLEAEAAAPTAIDRAALAEEGAAGAMALDGAFCGDEDEARQQREQA